MKILALDPGETTGYAFIEQAEGASPKEVQPVIRSYGVVPLWSGIDSLVDTCEPDIIILEAFRLYPHKARQQYWNPMLTSQVVGVVKYIAEQRKIEVVEQSASFGLSYELDTTDFREVRNRHARAALRHALSYLHSEATRAKNKAAKPKPVRLVHPGKKGG